jgi:hypothetical protein
MPLRPRFPVLHEVIRSLKKSHAAPKVRQAAGRRGSWVLAFTVSAILAASPIGPFGPARLLAVPMTNDPGGFLNIPWKSSLEGRVDLSPPEGEGRVKEYNLVRSPLRLGDVPVSSIRLVTIDAQFARAVVRYQGNDTHNAMLAALQRWFGALDLTPGQLAAGAQSQQQFAWRGDDTEISLTYDVERKLGVLYVESRTLAPRFNEDLGGQ